MNHLKYVIVEHYDWHDRRTTILHSANADEGNLYKSSRKALFFVSEPTTRLRNFCKRSMNRTKSVRNAC